MAPSAFLLAICLVAAATATSGVHGTECASKAVILGIGQRCGGDRNGCCQAGNIGSRQNQYPKCYNPVPARKPKYCTERFAPWDCNKFTVSSSAICVCSMQGDCTVMSKQNFNNIKNNQPGGYKATFCPRTSFANGNKDKIACQGKHFADAGKPTARPTVGPKPTIAPNLATPTDTLPGRFTIEVFSAREPSSEVFKSQGFIQDPSGQHNWGMRIGSTDKLPVILKGGQLTFNNTASGEAKKWSALAYGGFYDATRFNYDPSLFFDYAILAPPIADTSNKKPVPGSTSFGSVTYESALWSVIDAADPSGVPESAKELVPDYVRPWDLTNQQFYGSFLFLYRNSKPGQLLGITNRFDEYRRVYANGSGDDNDTETLEAVRLVLRRLS